MQMTKPLQLILTPKSGELIYSFTFINRIDNQWVNNVQEQYFNNVQQSRVYFAYILLASPAIYWVDSETPIDTDMNLKWAKQFINSV